MDERNDIAHQQIRDTPYRVHAGQLFDRWETLTRHLLRSYCKSNNRFNRTVLVGAQHVRYWEAPPCIFSALSDQGPRRCSFHHCYLCAHLCTGHGRRLHSSCLRDDIYPVTNHNCCIHSLTPSAFCHACMWYGARLHNYSMYMHWLYVPLGKMATAYLSSGVYTFVSKHQAESTQ